MAMTVDRKRVAARDAHTAQVGVATPLHRRKRREIVVALARTRGGGHAGALLGALVAAVGLLAAVVQITAF